MNSTESSPIPVWQQELRDAFRDRNKLLQYLGLHTEDPGPIQEAEVSFPLLVPVSFADRMKRGERNDPLLLQVLSEQLELQTPPGFTSDPLSEEHVQPVPGLLIKYPGRGLLIVTEACAVHCRYCFRRHFPYSGTVGNLQPALEYLVNDSSISEILLSGGDPLNWTDNKLSDLTERLEAIPHLKRLRIHTRLPIVIPSRVTDSLIGLLQKMRLKPVVVVHANHPAEIVGECASQLARLSAAGIMVLNQSVLLRGINDSSKVLEELSERLISVGVLPYYLHQLDRVQGAAHFEVEIDTGRKLIEQLSGRVPGYAVPRYVQEVPGEKKKVPLTG